MEWSIETSLINGAYTKSNLSSKEEINYGRKKTSFKCRFCENRIYR